MCGLDDAIDSHDSGRDTFLPLLIALIVTLVLSPLAKLLPVIAALTAFVAQLAGLYAVRHDRSFRAMVLGGFLLCLPLRLAAQFAGDRHPILIALTHAAVGAYFGLLGVVVLVRVIAHPRVSSQTVIGAICGYLLIGYVFTFGFLVLTFFDPTAIAVGGVPLGAENPADIGEHLVELFYFSFVSLTTVGYGDIVPVSSTARMLTVVEVLTGQLYLAAFVARLVGTLDRKREA